MQLVHSAATPPFSPRMNARSTRSFKVHFKLPVIKKASPTVSVTNTNAARVNTVSPPPPAFPELSSLSSIPFPSSPIPCPSRKRAISEDRYEPQEGGNAEEDEPMDVDVDEPEHKSHLPFHRRISHIDILRRRSKSCLATSYFHSDSHSPRKPHHMHDKPVPLPSPPEGPVKKKPAIRRESMSAGNPTGKTVRKAKRVLADAQFLASMHSSIALQVRTRIGHGVASDGDECAAQDVVLVERIWNTLVDMGYKPVPLDETPPAPSAPSPVSASPPANRDPAREAAERAARRTSMAVSSTPFTAQDLPPAPTGMLSVPQLVAVLTMRHRDRSTTRPRSASKKRAPEESPSPSRSPLSVASLSTVVPMDTS